MSKQKLSAYAANNITLFNLMFLIKEGTDYALNFKHYKAFTRLYESEQINYSVPMNLKP